MTCVFPMQPEGSCCPEWYDYPPAMRASARLAATEVLWELSGRRFTGIELPADEAKAAGVDDNTCALTIRPCRQHAGAACDMCGWPGPTAGPGWYLPWVPYLAGGLWYNASCSACGDSCACNGTLDELVLPGPVAEVLAVTVDGQDFPHWSLYDTATLIRTDGEPWPTCQDLGAELTEPGTWSVTYRRGVPVPHAGQRAASVLACELVRLCAEDKRCKIPSQVTQVTRDGVSFTFDPTEFFTNGLTGIPAVDMWLSAVNPGRNRRPSGVYTPQTVNRQDRVRRQPPEVHP